MGRFKIDEKYGMRIQNNGSLLAFVNFTDTTTGLEYRDWRLVQGSNGPFMSPPSQAYTDKEGQKKYSNYIRVAEGGKDETGQAFMDSLTEFVLSVYESGNSSSQGSAPARPASGRGPVASSSPKKSEVPW